MKKILLLLVGIIIAWNGVCQTSSPNQPKPFASCGTNESKISPENLAIIQNAQKYLTQKRASKQAATGGRIARIAVEIDYPTYQLFNGDTNLIKRETYLQFSQVSKVFERETNIRLVVTCFSFRKSPSEDPYYNLSNIFDLFDKQISIWENPSPTSSVYKFKNQYDKVVYMPVKPFYGAGGVALLGGNECLTPWGLANLTVAAHEIGHTFGSPHTQSCTWPGGPIDHCYPSEGGCYEKSLETIRGSIMSYCQSKDEFHPLCRAVMEQHAAQFLTEMSVDISPVSLMSAYTIKTSPFIHWQPSILAESYVSQVASDPGFTQILSQDTTKSPYVQLTNLAPQSTLYFRVMAMNSLAKASWSNTAVLSISANSVLPPSTKNIPFYWTSIFLDKELTLNVQSSPNAISYDVQIAGYYYPNFDYSSNFSFTGNQAKFFPSVYESRAVWRIRARSNNEVSEWSDKKVMFLGKTSNSPDLSQLYNPTATRVVNVNDIATSGASNVKFSIAKASNPSVKVFEQVRSPVEIQDDKKTFRVPNLENNQDYISTYELFREQENALLLYPSGTLLSLKASFKNLNSTIDTARVKYQGNLTVPDMLNTSVSGYIAGDYIGYSSMGGFVSFNTLNGTKTAFNHKNTDGALGAGVTSSYSLNSKNQLGALTRLAKIVNYSGVFPIVAYALNILDIPTGKLISSTILNKDTEIAPQYVDIENNYLIASDLYGLKLYSFEGEKLTPKVSLDFGNNGTQGNYVVNKDFLWQYLYNFSENRIYVKKFSIQDGTSSTYGENDLPEINSYYTSHFIDSKNRYWATNQKGIIMFDNGKWTAFRKYTNNLISPSQIAEGPDGTIYAYDENRILKFENNTWQIFANINLVDYYMQKMFVDKKELIWFVFDGYVIRYNPCTKTMSAPIFNTANNEIEYGQNVSLKAQGCSQVQWNWSSVKDSGNTISAKNELLVSPKSNTLYVAKCENEGCLSAASQTNVTVIPVLRLDSLSKICRFQPIKAYGRILGDIADSTSFSHIVRSNGKEYILKASTQKLNNQTVWQSESNAIGAGAFSLKIDAGKTKIAVKDTLSGVINALPLVDVTAAAVCAGDTLRFIASGAKSYNYYFNQKVYANASEKLELPNALSSLNQLSVRVLGTDANGCTNLDSARVNVKSLPVVTAEAPTQVYQNQTISLKAAGAMAYSWTGPTGFTASTQNANVLAVDTKYSGIYTVKGTDQEGCSNTAKVTVAVLIPLGIDEGINGQVSIYPNPTNDKITVKVNATGNNDIKLIDSFGNEKYAGSFKNSIEINVQHFSPGMYFVLLNNTTSVKVLVQ